MKYRPSSPVKVLRPDETGAPVYDEEATQALKERRKSGPPTGQQITDLRAFHVSEKKIASLTYSEARSLLYELRHKRWLRRKRRATGLAV